MEKSLRDSMFEYYNERAQEYDELYTSGKGPASINDPNLYIKETKTLQGMVRKMCQGKILDIPCGTAFWLPSYAENCTTAVLFDQSEKMLEQAQIKAIQAGIDNCCTYVRGDILKDYWEQYSFDSVLIGFFISHLINSQEELFFNKLSMALSPNGQFLILDSVWSEERAKTRAKSDKQKRRLNDGTEFDIYKKYFERADIESLGIKYGYKIKVHHFGKTFCAFSGRK